MNQQSILFGLMTRMEDPADPTVSDAAPVTPTAAPVETAETTTPAGDAPAAQKPEVPWWSNPLILLVAVMVPMFWLLSRPQKKERQKRQNMYASIKVGDQVMTTAGIYGTVVEMDRDEKRPTVTIRIDEKTNSKMRVSLYGIMERIGGDGDV